MIDVLENLLGLLTMFMYGVFFHVMFVSSLFMILCHLVNARYRFDGRAATSAVETMPPLSRAVMRLYMACSLMGSEPFVGNKFIRILRNMLVGSMFAPAVVFFVVASARPDSGARPATILSTCVLVASLLSLSPIIRQYRYAYGHLKRGADSKEKLKNEDALAGEDRLIDEDMSLSEDKGKRTMQA
jgi:hypothetical protein